MAYCEDEEKYYLYYEEDNTWRPIDVKLDDKGVSVSLYDIQKNVMRQLPAMKTSKVVKVINKWYEANPATYYMLLSNDNHYYTVFRNEADNQDAHFKKFSDAVMSCLNDISEEIYSCEITDDKSAIEIWVKNGDSSAVFYLFMYDIGVITYNE